ncbi:trypsin inhibitor 1A-like [Vigna radiata var. radiata]|uniref:Trypsin inhibitor 1A-like n=1 Tax=Vigna radiata var. radiata TaxID=3916 RepID=A0A1S3VYD5_VIGRR|nr:trypsin inhibitor 1A-like [Vigna radiata var. radiata]
MASATFFVIFLLSALTFYPPSTTAQPVTDGEGNIVRNGGRFYIRPRFFGVGGGIERARTGDEGSPLSVVQSPFDTDPGQPWIIGSLTQSLFIPEGRVSISYEYVQLGDSVESNEWVAVEVQLAGTVVKVGYSNAISGFFTIHRASTANTYKFQFCSTAGSCSNVGIVRDEAGNRILAINQGTPFFEFYLQELPYEVSK